MRILHEPNLRTVMMVEKAMLDAKTYPTKKELWRSLPKGVQYQTFARVLEYLEASGKIAFDGPRITYTGIDSPKLRELFETSVPI